MKRCAVVFVLIGVLFGCKKETAGVGNGVLEEGIWVEVEYRKDTLVFQSYEDGSTLLLLNRERESRNGHQGPKIGAGPYIYKFIDGGISLYWTLSSNYHFDEYPFEHTGTKLKIGDFYEGTGGLKTFVQANK